MGTEIPVCKRCFCLPLRYGLLLWCYFKIVEYLFLIPAMVYYIAMMNILFSVFDGIHNANDMAQVLIDLILPIATIMTFMTDLVATILFVVAGHKKNVKLLRVFYFYSIAMFIVTVLLVTFILGPRLQYIIMLLSVGALDNIVIITLTFFVVLVQQTFFLLLLRSENIKLKNTQAKFGFLNNAAEAKCIMKCPEIEEGQENEEEDV